MKRVKLRILGISYSPLKSGAFALLLAQEHGPYRIPVMIGALEAQSIAIKIEGVVTPRPVTHDLLCSLAHSFKLELVEVFIYKFEEGIFYSELLYTDGERNVVLESRTSDAIAIAIRTGAPIYTTEEVLYTTGAIFNTSLDDSDAETDSCEGDSAERDDTEEVELEVNYDPTSSDAVLDMLDTNQLEDLLQKMIDEENYEEAARISEIIKSRKK